MVGSGANYDNAYFEVSYVKTYTTAPPAVAIATPTGSTLGAASNSAGRVSSYDTLFYLVLGICGTIVMELL